MLHHSGIQPSFLHLLPFARTVLLYDTIHSTGLFSVEDKRRGSFIVEYEGEVVSVEVVDNR